MALDNKEVFSWQLAELLATAFNIAVNKCFAGGGIDKNWCDIYGKIAAAKVEVNRRAELDETALGQVASLQAGDPLFEKVVKAIQPVAHFPSIASQIATYPKAITRPSIGRNTILLVAGGGALTLLGGFLWARRKR